jgi:hypothetical protein
MRLRYANGKLVFTAAYIEMMVLAVLPILASLLSLLVHSVTYCVLSLISFLIYEMAVALTHYTNEVKVAAHEVGHVLTLRHLQMLTRVSVVPDHTRRIEGEVVFLHKRVPDNNDLFYDTVMSLGGPAGEYLQLGKVCKYSCSADLAHALRCAKSLNLNQQSGPVDLDLGAYYDKRPDDEVVNKLNYCFMVAVNMIASQRINFQILTDRLMKEKIMDGNRVRALVVQRSEAQNDNQVTSTTSTGAVNPTAGSAAWRMHDRVL